MAKQKFGLGRGLDALISGASDIIPAHQPSRIDENSILFAAIESIMPNPRQPRRYFPENDPKLIELSNSIKEHGLLQPIVVKRLDAPEQGDDPWSATVGVAAGQERDTGVVQFQIIAGERRWRASRLAGLTKVPVVIKEVTPQQMLELALIENIQRADLNPIEEALAYQALIQDFDMTQEMVAKQVGKDRSTVTNAIRLLKLAPRVREALINQSEHFSEGHARALIGIAREEDQVTAMGKIITQHLNVRQAEELAARIKGGQPHEAPTPERRSLASEYESLATSFRDSLMVKVDLKCNPKGKGTLVLHFNNQEELERLYNKLVKHEE